MKRDFIKNILLSSIGLLTASVIVAGSCVDVYAASSIKATNIQYYMKDGKKTGIRSFTIDPCNYYSISGDLDAKGGSVALTDGQMRKIVANDILPKWGVLGEAFFRDEASQLVTIEGSGMMSSDKSAKNSFDRQFSTSITTDGYDYDWALPSLGKTLGGAAANTGIRVGNKTNPRTGNKYRGGILEDYSTSTGLVSISSLSDARRKMAKELENAADDYDNTVDDFLGTKYKNTSEYRLPDMEDDKSGAGFCNIVTCINQAGASNDYDYVSFGIAIYDLKLTPIAADDLKYVEAAQDYEDVKAAKEAGVSGLGYTEEHSSVVKSKLRNDSGSEVTHEVSLERSATEEVSNSTEKSFEWGLEESVGGERNVGTCISCVAKWTWSFGVTSSQTWSSTEGKSETKSTSDTSNVTTSVTLPAYTCTQVNQNQDYSEIVESYNCPVTINYKVCLFAMSGDFYNGLHAGGVSPSTYDKQWLSIKFDNGTSFANTGCVAINDLRTRAIDNVNVTDYDYTKGKLRAWCDKSGWSLRTDINWSSIMNNIKNDMKNYSRYKSSFRCGVNADGTYLYGSEPLNSMVNYLPMCELPSQIQIKCKNVHSDVAEILPIHNLDNVSLSDKSDDSYTLGKDEKLYLNTVEIQGYNDRGGEYYGFDDADGSWVYVDVDDESDEIVLNSDNIGQAHTVSADDPIVLNKTANGRQYVSKVDGKSGTAVLQWQFNDPEKRFVSDESGAEGIAAREITDLPVVTITAKDSGLLEKGTIEVSGSYSGLVGDEVDLNKYFDVRVLDGTGFEVKKSIQWKQVELNGIDVKADGTMTSTEPGNYRVKVGCYLSNSDGNTRMLWSDPISISVKDKSVLTSIVLEQPNLDESELLLDAANDVITIPLSECVELYDQYGEEYEGEAPQIDFTVSNGDYAFIDDYDNLYINGEGTYRVYASYKPVGSEEKVAIRNRKAGTNFLKFTVSIAPYLYYVQMSAPTPKRSDMTITATHPEVCVPNLANYLEYYAQTWEYWNGTKPKATFSLDPDVTTAEIANGNFYATEPGYYTIHTSIGDYALNDITITVYGEGLIGSVKTYPAAPLECTDLEPTASLNLFSCIDVLDTFDDKIKADALSEIVSFKFSGKHAGATIKDGELLATKAGTFAVVPVVSGYSKEIEPIQVEVTYRETGQKEEIPAETPHLKMKPKEKQQLSTTGLYGLITYNSSDTDIATVSSTGLIKAKKVGTATITIHATGTEGYADPMDLSIQVIVGTPIKKVVLKKKVSAYNGEEQKIEVVSINGKKDLVESVDYTIEYPAEMKDAGTYQIRIHAGETGPISGTTTVKYQIKKAKPTVTTEVTTVHVGETIPLDVLTESTGKITYTSKKKKLATIDENGNVKGLKPGKVKIQIKVAADKNYVKVAKTIILNVVEPEDVTSPLDGQTF